MRSVMFVVLMAGCGGTQRAAAPSPNQCKELFDHLLDLEFFGDGYGEAHFMHDEAIQKANAGSFQQTCTEQMPVAHVKCALATEDRDAALRCDSRFDVSVR